MKILHLEDNPRDAELTHGSVREQWPDCEILTVSTHADFQAALATSPDLILSDFNIPTYNGLEALRLARTMAPETPFIFLSGTIGEERALEALRSRPNVHFLGAKPAKSLPGYVQHIDVCLATYCVDGYTKFISPLKVNEYLAAGKPVVGSPIEPLLPYREVIRIAQPPQEWVQSIEECLTPAVTSAVETARRRQRDLINLPMSHGDIADYLGLTPETVSRVFKHLRDSGVVSYTSSRRVTVNRIDGLRQFVM